MPICLSLQHFLRCTIAGLAVGVGLLALLEGSRERRGAELLGVQSATTSHMEMFVVEFIRPLTFQIQRDWHPVGLEFVSSISTFHRVVPDEARERYLDVLDPNSLRSSNRLGGLKHTKGQT